MTLREVNSLSKAFDEVLDVGIKLVPYLNGLSHQQVLILAEMIAYSAISDLHQIDPEDALFNRDEFSRVFLKKTDLILNQPSKRLN